MNDYRHLSKLGTYMLLGFLLMACVPPFDLDRNQISDVLPYAKNGVGKLKYRVAQKLGVEGKNLRKNLIHIAINERIDH